jgi:hypothetical protein
MQEWIEFIKAIVRPFIIVWGASLYALCLIRSVEAPDLLAGLVSAVILEYFGERAIIRIKESNNAGKTGGES